MRGVVLSDEEVMRPREGGTSRAACEGACAENGLVVSRDDEAVETESIFVTLEVDVRVDEKEGLGERRESAADSLYIMWRLATVGEV
jgi:hypothetical protein